MRNAHERLASLALTAMVAALALPITTPAEAQFGGLKKKAKAAVAPAQPAEASGEAAPGPGAGGTIVLTDDVIERLVAGLEAAEAERQAATKEDTPYGRHHRALAAYQVAKPKCEAEQQTFAHRMVADEKMMERYNGFINKMVEAQGRGDNSAAMAYNDSAMAMQGPDCVVKQPQQPDGYYEAQREIDTRAERASIKVSGFSQAELAQIRERVEAVLRGGTPPGDLSASEESAVAKRADQLKRLLGIEAPPATPAKTVPAAAAAPPTQPAPAAPSGTSDLSACMAQNAQKHEKEIRALGDRAKAAQEAGNTAALMAIADTLQRLQTAGCDAAR